MRHSTQKIYTIAARFALLSGAVAAWTLPLSAQAESQTKPCRHPAFPQEVQCGEILRPLDPAQPQGKKIAIHYVVLPSKDRNKLSDAVFLLAGGPGQSATKVAGFGETLLSRLNRRRDLVFVDQRGTGKSAPLTCTELEDNQEVIDMNEAIKRVLSCKDRLQKLEHGDLRFYSTSIAVQDLEAVRQAQQYTAVNLVGASYGTRVGLEYMRQYPSSVRRLVIDGVVPPDLNLLASDAQAALQGVFADCKANSRCQQAYPDLEQNWAELLQPGKRAVSFIHPRLGHTIKANLGAEDFISMVFKGLYSPTVTAVLPYAITQAKQGNVQPLLTMSGAGNRPDSGAMAMGMHYSVWCGEAYARQASVEGKDVFGRLMSGMYGQICSQWPRATIPDAFFQIPSAPAPVLLFSGGIDPVTPTRNGNVVATALGAKAKHVVIENAGHGLLSQGCVREVVSQFIMAKDEQAAQSVDTSCVRQIPRPLVWLAPVEKKKSASTSVSGE